MAQLVVLLNPRPFRAECIGCARPLDVPAGWQIFAGDLEHAICDRCALKVDAKITAEREETNRRSPAEP
jgi:predicted Fe-S protein YdhL (DUF1289 family)